MCPARPAEAPKGLGTKLPVKKEGAGKKGAAGPASPAGGEGASQMEKEEVPMVRVEAKSLEVRDSGVGLRWMG